MHHLITGGSGFLGDLIARRLHERGERVRVLDVWEDPSRPPAIAFVQADVCDRPAVAKALEGIDIVHHTAALVPLSKSGELYWKVNVEGSRIVAEEAVRAGVRSFIHMSSSAVYGCPERCPIRCIQTRMADSWAIPISMHMLRFTCGRRCRISSLPSRTFTWDRI